MPNATPSVWAAVLDSSGPAGLALIVMVVLLFAQFGASVTLVTLLIKHILKEERIPKAVWVQECQTHETQMSNLDKLATVIEKCVWVLERVAQKVGA